MAVYALHLTYNRLIFEAMAYKIYVICTEKPLLKEEEFRYA